MEVKKRRKVFKEVVLRESTMNKWAEILVGLILLIVPIYAWIVNFLGMGEAALTFFKGGVVWLVILIGLLFLMLGISDLKE